MKRHLFSASICSLVLLIVTTYGCNNSLSPKDHKLSLTDLKPKFKYHNLDKFELDNYTWEERAGKYHVVDSGVFYLIHQDGKRQYSNEDTNTEYLFAWQENRDTNFIEFVLLSQDDSYCSLLTYYIFSKNGKQLGSVVLDAACGDGGWTYISYGKFTDNYTVESVSVECETNSDSINNKLIEVLDCDSIITRYYFSKKGSIKEQEIFKRHFMDTTIMSFNKN